MVMKLSFIFSTYKNQSQYSQCVFILLKSTATIQFIVNLKGSKNQLKWLYAIKILCVISYRKIKLPGQLQF